MLKKLFARNGTYAKDTKSFAMFWKEILHPYLIFFEFLGVKRRFKLIYRQISSFMMVSTAFILKKVPQIFPQHLTLIHLE